MAAACFLAFDIGASGGRASLGRFDGRRLTLTEVHRFSNGPLRILDRLHWDVSRLYRELETGLRCAAAHQEQLDGIGVDTWGVDFGLLSASGQLLGLPYHYRDARTRGMFAEAFRRVPRAEIYAQTGTQFMEINTLYQLLATQAADPRLLAAADHLLFMPDLLNYWLTGLKCSENTIASTSQLFDAGRREWAENLIGRLDLPARIMPPLCKPGTPLGLLRRGLAAEAGVSPAQVIATAGHDTAAAVAAVPARGDDWAYISSGTWSLVGVELQAPLCTAAALQGNFTNEAGVRGTTRLLKNVAGLWLVQECQRYWAERGNEFTFEELEDQAAAAAAGGCLIDPDDPVFVAPGDMPRRIQEQCSLSGQRVPQTPGEVVRCVLESLALKYRSVIDQLEQLIGRRLRVLHIVGGGVRNAMLCQLTADATQRLVVAGPVEATCAGNVLVQAMARAHVQSLAEIRSVVADSTALRKYEPRAGQSG